MFRVLVARHGECRTWRTQDEPRRRNFSFRVGALGPNWQEWGDVDTLLGEVLHQGYDEVQGWEEEMKRNIGRGESDAEKYDWARYVLGTCMLYQESEEHMTTNPRFRLKDYLVDIKELRQGERVLLPYYSHRDLMNLIKLLWNLLKPARSETGENHLLIVAVDHEGCSSSFWIEGFMVDIVWTLCSELHEEIQKTYDAVSEGDKFEVRKALVDDLMRLFLLNRGDVAVVEDGSLVGRGKDWWTSAVNEAGKTVSVFTPPSVKNQESWETQRAFQHTKDVPGDVTGLLGHYGKLPSDYILTLAYPDETELGYCTENQRNAFKKCNKCALAMYFWKETRGDLVDDCTIRRGQPRGTSVRAARLYQECNEEAGSPPISLLLHSTYSMANTYVRVQKFEWSNVSIV